MTAPANDNFADAIVLSGALPITRTGDTNVDATLEEDEPVLIQYEGYEDYAAMAASVWYSWTASVTGEISIDLAGSDFDTVLAVYTGSTLAGLTRVTSDDDSGEGYTSRVTFSAISGTTYHIQVGGYLGDWGSIAFSLTAAPPDNDLFADSVTIVLSGGSATLIDRNVDETTETGEPLTFAAFGFDGTISNTSWFNWTADADGIARFDTFGSDFDTTAAVFVGGSVSGLTCLAFNDDYDGDDGLIPQSEIAWAAADGTTYYIQVGGTASGSITAHLYFDPYPTGVTPDPPFSSGTASAYRIELRSLNSAGFDVTTESLELTSFSCNWRLNGPGAFEGTGVVGVTQADAANVGARELLVYKDSTAIWGGYLTYLDVDEDTKAVRVAAEGYWSRARMRLIRGDQLYKPLTNYGIPWKANVIAWDIIDQAQGASYGDMGWVYGGHSGTRLDCKRIYRGVDRQNVGGAIEALAAEGYFDFSLDVRATPSEGNVAAFRTWRRRGSDLSGSVNLSASNAMQLNYSLSSSDMATVIDVFGSVQGCRGVAATESQNLATYGRLEATPIDMETDEQSEVDNTASEFIEQHSIPAKNATVTYLEGVGPDLTDYDLGDTIRVTPGDGYLSYFDARVVGRELAVEAGRAVVTVEVER